MPSPGEPEFSPDGKLFAVAGGDNLIRVYSTAAYTQELVLAGSPDQPFGMAFSPDSSRLVSAVPGQLRSWDLSPQGQRHSATSTPPVASWVVSPSPPTSPMPS